MDNFLLITNISSGLRILKFAAPREKSGFYSEGRALVVSLPNQQPGPTEAFLKSALQAAEKEIWLSF
jgi:hypothetical protein